MGGGGDSCDIFILIPWYLGLFFTSSAHIMLNSSQHLHQSFLASCAPRAFFSTIAPIHAITWHIHHSSSASVPLDTCFFPKGSQCSHPYLWTRCIPKMGTNTNNIPMTPKHQGVCMICLTRS